MRLFHFHDSTDYCFARAGRLGTWSAGTGICRECGRSPQRRIPPLILEWSPDSDRVGDFVWPGLDDEVVVTDGVRQAFEGRFQGFEFQPLLMRQDPKLKRPQRPTRRTKPRVWLPYEGPQLWDLWVTAWCHLNLQQSGLRLEKVCSTCGMRILKAPPFEQRHLAVDPDTWDGSDIFHTHEYPRWIFCTERVKGFVEDAGYSNVSFLEDGVIPV